MSIKDTVSSMEENLKAYYDALETAGGEVPEEKNLANLAGTAGSGSSQYKDMAIVCVGVDGAYPGNVCMRKDARSKSINSNFVTSSSNYYNTSSTGILLGISVSGPISKSMIKELYVDLEGVVSGDYFLGSSSTGYSFNNLQELELTGVGGFGNNVGTYTSALKSCIISPYDSNVAYAIGNDFFNPSGVQKITFNGAISSIGTRFLHNCDRLQEVYVPANAPIPDDARYRALSTTNVSAVSYVNGITLKGPGAAAWKAALPDRTSSPYRKLILDENTPPLPTLKDVKDALNKGTAETDFPVGTEIPDTYQTRSNPLIVAHYADISLADGSTKPGVYLVRKRAYGSGIYGADKTYESISNDYKTLFSRYASEQAQEYLAELKIDYYIWGTILSTTAKEFAMSPNEVMGNKVNWSTGTQWDLWSKRTGLNIGSNGSNDANSGRVVQEDYDEAGVHASIPWLLRDQYNGLYLANVTQQGKISYENNKSLEFLAACAIVKD